MTERGLRAPFVASRHLSHVDSSTRSRRCASPPTLNAVAQLSVLDAATHSYDVVIVGGGPSGSSCAYWLAKAGWDVLVLEKKVLPREKTCGDGLTPRSVRQLADMGLEDAVAATGHKYVGLRANGFGQKLELEWPATGAFPSYGYCITRLDLDDLVATNAANAGATLCTGAEVLSVDDLGPVVPGHGLSSCGALTVKDKASGQTVQVKARYFVVADGANSRIGRSLGAARNRQWPSGLALRGYFTSPRHDDPFIESYLDIRDHDGSIVPGYGWIFPLGDGRINVGVGLLSTDKRWKGVNTTKLMETFCAYADPSWGISPETATGPATGGKLPMGLAIGPRTGSNVVVIGDAAGTVNPFNGEGISYGYETGRMAAAAVADALLGAGSSALVDFDKELDAAYGDYYRVARVFVRVISDPKVMALCVGAGMRSQWLMEEILRLMSNLFRPDHRGAAEIGYDALEALTRTLPQGLAERLLAAS